MIIIINKSKGYANPCKYGKRLFNYWFFFRRIKLSKYYYLCGILSHKRYLIKYRLN